jgi:polar amino acid transport system ATP-binding protein
MTDLVPAQLVRFDNVSKSYGDNQVLKDISLTVNHGEIVCLIGPSGGGKSTLLRSINHLCEVDAGTIEVDGESVGVLDKGGRIYKRSERDIARMRAKIGMVFQHFNLFANMTALENITYAPRIVHGKSKSEASKVAHDLLELVGLQQHAGKLPSQLSGGQQQRVAIARALAIDPKVCLFDEPTSALDPELVGDVLDVMRKLAHAGLTMMIATHEITFAREIAHRVLVLDGGEIIDSGDPSQVIDHPTSPRTQRFLARLHQSIAVDQ